MCSSGWTNMLNKVTFALVNIKVWTILPTVQFWPVVESEIKKSPWISWLRGVVHCTGPHLSRQHGPHSLQMGVLQFELCIFEVSCSLNLHPEVYLRFKTNFCISWLRGVVGPLHWATLIQTVWTTLPSDESLVIVYLKSLGTFWPS